MKNSFEIIRKEREIIGLIALLLILGYIVYEAVKRGDVFSITYHIVIFLVLGVYLFLSNKK